MTGRIKQHRVDLIEQLLVNNLLDHATYSIFDDRRQKVNVGNSQLIKIIKDCTESNRYNYDIGDGLAYDVNLFKESVFQVIVETDFDNGNVWITEKTWISIINRRPFIMHSDANTLARLKSLGFRTFENYLKIPNYDSIMSRSERLNAIIENIKYWLTDIKKYSTEIQEDIDFNFDKLLELADINNARLDNFMIKHNITCSDQHVVPTGMSLKNIMWNIFYNNIKGTNWPDCRFFRDFSNLSEVIKQECMSDPSWEFDNWLRDLTQTRLAAPN